MAREYHSSLQEQGLETDSQKRNECENEVLNNLTAKATERQKQYLGTCITKDEVEQALKSSKKNSATGLDGLTYEFWCELNTQVDPLLCDNRRREEPLKIIDLITAAFNDIQLH